jgi:hypothetical protein
MKRDDRDATDQLREAEDKLNEALLTRVQLQERLSKGGGFAAPSGAPFSNQAIAEAIASYDRNRGLR